MEKRDKVIYWIFTGLLSFMMIMGAGRYFVQHDIISQGFQSLGYPTYLIYPLGVC